jgi:hypothetical protein
VRPIAGAPAWWDRLTAEFNASGERAVAIAEKLTLAQLNWKPIVARA